MKKIKIFQIYYNADSYKLISPEFTPFDNSKPKDGSWYEYSAIREIIKKNDFEENDFVGIFSPRFHEKTGLDANHVIKVIQDSDKDIISFSPKIFMSSLFLNSYLQGEMRHPGFLNVSQLLLNELNINIDLKTIIQDRSRIIFSNYFVAKFSLWKKWFEYTEKVYDISKQNNSKISNLLNTSTVHRGDIDSYQFKVFFIERFISIFLELNEIDAYIGSDINKYSYANSQERDLLPWAIIMDSLKSQYIKTKKIDYISIYENTKKQFSNF